MTEKHFDISPAPQETGTASTIQTRRTLLRTMATGGMLASVGGGWLAPSAGAHAQAPKKGGRIMIATQSVSTADTLDPAKASLSTDYLRVNMLYNGLTALDANLVPQLMLAREMDNKDATLWTFKLRTDVRFHGGQKLTSADVVYSLMRHQDAALGAKSKTVSEQIEWVKANGPHEVQIQLKGPNADFPVILGTAHFLIIRDGAKDFSTANGTGPFKCKEFTPGVRTVVVRNTEYWRTGLPYLDEVVLFGIPDESSRINALLSGAVHWINDVNPRSTKRIRDNPDYTILETRSGLYTDLIMRQDRGPGQNPDFTLGMKLLIDREQIKRAAFRGYAVLGNDQPINPGHRYYFSGLPQRTHDPERAKFHLKKAGVIGSTIPLVASVAATGSVDMALLLQQSAKKIGLDLSLKRVSADGYWSKHWMKSQVGFGNVNPRPSADLLFTQFYKSDAAWNVSGWKNDQFDQLLVAARGETNEITRKQMYADMQVLAHEKCGVGIPVFISALEGHSARIKGIVNNPLGAFMGYTAPEYVWLDS
jgi:peptide/nickel transport system substrate-binding protein